MCIEPWCCIADKMGLNGNISERDRLHCLEPEETYVFTYTLQIFQPDRNEKYLKQERIELTKNININ